MEERCQRIVGRWGRLDGSFRDYLPRPSYVDHEADGALKDSRDMMDEFGWLVHSRVAART
jgi:hypothetical protein